MDNSVADAYLTNALFSVYTHDSEFSYRLLDDDVRGVGELMTDRTAWTITSTNQWFSVFGKMLFHGARPPGLPVDYDL